MINDHSNWLIQETTYPDFEARIITMISVGIPFRHMAGLVLENGNMRCEFSVKKTSLCLNRQREMVNTISEAKPLV